VTIEKVDNTKLHIENCYIGNIYILRVNIFSRNILNNKF